MATNGRVKVPDAQCLQGRLLRGVRLHRLRHIGGQGLHQLRILINRQHLMAQLAQVSRQAVAKAAQPKDKILLSSTFHTFLH